MDRIESFLDGYFISCSSCQKKSMSQESVEKFLGRLITDDDFRRDAKDYLLKTCIENGYSLTEPEQNILQTIDFDAFISLSDSIDRGIKRCGSKDLIKPPKHGKGNIHEDF